MSNEVKIQIGDIVRLVSGGPKMTVVQFRHAGIYNVVNCVYIHNGEPKMITDLPTNCIDLCYVEA